MKAKTFDKKNLRRIALTAMAVAIIIGLHPVYDGLIAKVQLITATDVILIDPGHGGMDGGASSDSGTDEKDINLAIAFQIRELAEADGWKVVLTREDDRSLGANKSKTIRSQKTADLIARRDMIKDVSPTVAVSIHLNSFKLDRSVRGAQTFYPGSGDQAVIDESKIFAEAIQEQLVTGINDGTERSALAKRDALIFKNPTVPMAIIECGFLSNPDEAKLLELTEYQKKLAKHIYDGIMVYTGREPKAPIKTIDSRG